jgi:rare lipoprotein A (peptidoglycan hydrolase)
LKPLCKQGLKKRKIKSEIEGKILPKNFICKFLLFLSCFVLTRCSLRPNHQVEGVQRSQNPYEINGKKYYPIHYYDYEEEGLSSWYGPGFHGEKKAQGEIYNKYGMTAAHKTLPLPSIVQVTNLENGKTIIVLIDDRGPFKKKRIIDLSASAAKELGIYNQGIGKVRIKALPRESHALAMYLKQNGNQAGLDLKKRTWEEVYKEEIGSRPGYHNLTPISSHVRKSNENEQMWEIRNAERLGYPPHSSFDSTCSTTSLAFIKAETGTLFTARNLQSKQRRNRKGTPKLRHVIQSMEQPKAKQRPASYIQSRKKPKHKEGHP